LIEKLDIAVKSNKMEEISRKNPEGRKKITYTTEDELYKHKKKLYPQTTNNCGEGYS